MKKYSFSKEEADLIREDCRKPMKSIKSLLARPLPAGYAEAFVKKFEMVDRILKELGEKELEPKEE